MPETIGKIRKIDGNRSIYQPDDVITNKLNFFVTKKVGLINQEITTFGSRKSKARCMMSVQIGCWTHLLKNKTELCLREKLPARPRMYSRK